MTNLRRKDRFRGRRKYFDSFPMNYYTEPALSLYFMEAYHFYGANSSPKWFGCLNKLIYRVAKRIGWEPSRITAEILSIWIECRSESVANVLRMINELERHIIIRRLAAKASKTGLVSDMSKYLRTREQVPMRAWTYE